MTMRLCTMLTVALAVASLASAQSSSLFAEGEQLAVDRSASTQPSRDGPLAAHAGAAVPADPNVNEALNQVSFMAVAPVRQRAFRLHDGVTIIVLETMRYRSDNQFQQDKRWDIQAKLAKWFRIDDHKWIEQPFAGGIPEIDLKTNDRRTGNGRQNRQDELATRITGEVIDIKPNGQLVIQAQKTLRYEEESQTITLTGRCRSEDVTAANSVLSTQLIDLSVDTRNDGKVTDAGKRGWLQRIFDKVRPF